ncbi:MAG: hypothetical protein ACI4LI_03010 [Candidatus Fimenecus sp.]
MTHCQNKKKHKAPLFAAKPFVRHAGVACDCGGGCTAFLKKQMRLSIADGTVAYVLLVQFVF